MPTSSIPPPAGTQVPLPCVVQVGFAGARDLIGGLELTATQEQVEEELRRELEGILKPDGWLQKEMSLSQEHYFFCGVSQIAIGSDLQFTEACKALTIPQQVCLPVHREAYFSAKSSDGTDHFTKEQAAYAESLLKSAHVISERIVAESPDQTTRFEEVNMHLLRISDVVIGVVRKDQEAKRGGTIPLLEAARRQKRHVVQITIDRGVDGGPRFQRAFSSGSNNRPQPLPPLLAAVRVTVKDGAPFGLPSIHDYATVVRNVTRTQAGQKKRFFDLSATTILKTHVTATALATLVLVLHGLHHPDERQGGYVWSLHGGHLVFSIGLLFLLAIELYLLHKGWKVHGKLEHERTTVQWSTARSIAEIGRSVLNTPPELGVSLEHLFRLPFQSDLRSLVRTLNVLQFIALAGRPKADPIADRAKSYVKRRLTAVPDNEENLEPGQRHYYNKDVNGSFDELHRADQWFRRFTGVAWGFVVAEIGLLTFPGLALPWVSGIASFFAITCPVAAVAVLSWAASRDFEARHASYTATLRMINDMVPRLENAQSDVEFEQLVRKVEVRLLTEVLDWQSRMRHKGVA